MIRRDGKVACDGCGGLRPSYRRTDEATDNNPCLYCANCVERDIAYAGGEATAALELIEAAMLKARQAGLRDGEISEALRLALTADEHAPQVDSPTLQAVPDRDDYRRRLYCAFEEVAA